MAGMYRAWRAVSPSDGAVSWVVVDDDVGLHVEACAFLAGLRGRDRSVNTERVYAGRVALFLSWCAGEGIDWKRVRLDQMARFKRWLVAEPLPSRQRAGNGPSRYRSPATADAVLGTVCEFLRFCALHELVDPAAVAKLYESRYLRFLPPGMEAGEDGRRRTVRSRLLKFSVPDAPFEFVEPDRIEDLVAAAGNPRDRFLVAVVAMTGTRIGETLARFWAVIDLGRASGLLDELPGTFTRSTTQRIVTTEANEDEIGKAIPETVIAQLDAHLDLLGADRTYGRVWSASGTSADDFVVRNLADQADAFTNVAAAMRDRLAQLPDDERAEVEAASAVLRKMRAGSNPSEGRKLIPLSVDGVS